MQFDTEVGGGTPSGSGIEGEATVIRGAEPASDSVRGVLQEMCLWVVGGESEGARLGFNSLCEVSTATLQAG